MKALIVDDEPLARARLFRLLTDLQQFSEILQAANADEALRLNAAAQPEVVFLDIAMPGLNGLQLAERLATQTLPPAVIYVTAHPEHALDAYNTAPMDYLLKPVSSVRLAQAVARLHKPTLTDPLRGRDSAGVLSYQQAGVQRQLAVTQVLYFQAEDKYVKAVTTEDEILLELSLQQLQESFPQYLIRIHRSTLINKLFFDSIQQKEQRHFVTLRQCPVQLEVSRRLLTPLRNALGL
ncbi:LytTR family DNA-binding domain-containing protein [Rheinheimera sp. UJ51]|uniref:LytR/AlgR family response regulator transcription factor n=1 Tax=unclassified Rheinheimera TaxID=115860 RepID=UPI001E29B03F|nr:MULTISPECIES: LytTR family DNA-binding domain-containing protein [unclassified Rheinheimera]MCC5452644.1 LytTR family DNA-binding domain-containing protein [Rheinheimera sp. UJ51]MCF4010208.1 LytTR family DNA-binding domain-containing protein [Rheinheimera sp. UJ63]